MTDASGRKGGRGGLGRGIGALIPQSATSTIENLRAVPGIQLVEVDPGQVRPNPRQPRSVFDETALSELEHSVREFGVLQPIVVRSSGTGYELIMGERRLRAAKRAGLAKIPALVRDTKDDSMLRDALLENLHRSDLNALEEASAYRQLLDDFGITQDQLADRLGRSRPQISNTLRLLRLPETVQQMLVSGAITAGHARALLALENAQVMQDLAKQVIRQGLSVRALEELISIGKPSKKAPRGKITPGARSELTTEFVERLEDKLNTRVSIKMGSAASKNGQLIIEFASYADLKRILNELGIEAK